MSGDLGEQVFGTDYPADEGEVHVNGHRLLQPVDLGDLVEADHPRPPVHGNLIYARKMHVIGGEPGDGKSTMLAWWLLLAISRGYHVALFDWEAGRDHTADLLKSMGAEPARVSKFLHYYPHTKLNLGAPHGVAALTDELLRVRPVIAGFDSTIALLTQMGGHENDATAIRALWMTLAPIGEEADCAIIATDHSGKDAGASRYMRGSTDKLAAVDVSIKLTAERRFSRHQDGRLRLSVTKDRPGWLHWDWAVNVTRGPLALHWRETRPPQSDALHPAAVALDQVLTDEPATIKTLVDRVVQGGGYPQKPDTAYRNLCALAEIGKAEKVDQGQGMPALWCRPQQPPEPGPQQDTLV